MRPAKTDCPEKIEGRRQSDSDGSGIIFVDARRESTAALGKRAQRDPAGVAWYLTFGMVVLNKA